MDKTTWYERFARIPGIIYVTPPGTRPPNLPKRFLTPVRNHDTRDDNGHEWLTWKNDEGETSASPAHRWPPTTDPHKPSPALILQRLHETLELPGIGSDYHFALLGAYTKLLSHARRDPTLYAEVERLCLLDIELVERLPSAIRLNKDDTPAHVPAYSILVSLYEQNGLLDDALAVARRAAAAGQASDNVERIEERQAALRAEDA